MRGLCLPPLPPPFSGRLPRRSQGPGSALPPQGPGSTLLPTLSLLPRGSIVSLGRAAARGRAGIPAGDPGEGTAGTPGPPAGYGEKQRSPQADSWRLPRPPAPSQWRGGVRGGGGETYVIPLPSPHPPLVNQGSEFGLCLGLAFRQLCPMPCRGWPSEPAAPHRLASALSGRVAGRGRAPLGGGRREGCGVWVLLQAPPCPPPAAPLIRACHLSFSGSSPSCRLPYCDLHAGGEGATGKKTRPVHV